MSPDPLYPGLPQANRVVQSSRRHTRYSSAPPQSAEHDPCLKHCPPPLCRSPHSRSHHAGRHWVHSSGWRRLPTPVGNEDRVRHVQHTQILCSSCEWYRRTHSRRSLRRNTTQGLIPSISRNTTPCPPYVVGAWPCQYQKRLGIGMDRGQPGLSTESGRWDLIPPLW